MTSFFEEEATVDDDELIRVAAAMINDLYNLQTDEKEQLKLKRTSKKQTWEYIVDILTEKVHPCTVSEIENELNKFSVVVTRATVGNYMNDTKLFTKTGEG